MTRVHASLRVGAAARTARVEGLAAHGRRLDCNCSWVSCCGVRFLLCARSYAASLSCSCLLVFSLRSYHLENGYGENVWKGDLRAVPLVVDRGLSNYDKQLETDHDVYAGGYNVAAVIAVRLCLAVTRVHSLLPPPSFLITCTDSFASIRHSSFQSTAMQRRRRVLWVVRCAVVLLCGSLLTAVFFFVCALTRIAPL